MKKMRSMRRHQKKTRRIDVLLAEKSLVSQVSIVDVEVSFVLSTDTATSTTVASITKLWVRRRSVETTLWSWLRKWQKFRNRKFTKENTSQHFYQVQNQCQLWWAYHEYKYWNII